MGWNVDLACVHDPDRALRLDDAVPDVFVPAPDPLCFEDAASAFRGSGLAVARLGAWIVVLDTNGRLSGPGRAPDHLDELSSGGRDVHVVRLADVPAYRLHRDGRRVRSADGAACRTLLDAAHADATFGEDVATGLVHQLTGLGWDDLFDASYAAFALP
jgi:hypothetical protein